VFNITEGLYGIAREAQVPALLDAYRIPYTFSDTSVLALTMHKALCKRVVRDLGVPTPDFAAYILLKKSNPSTFPFLCSSSPRGGTGTA
jgi:D-alanine-D-alanine ligase-like ATP-grasp enzyme